MEWALFVKTIASNPWLLLSWEFTSSAFAAVIVFYLTGHRIDVSEIRARVAEKVLGKDRQKSLRQRIAERIAGRELPDAPLRFRPVDGGKSQDEPSA